MKRALVLLKGRPGRLIMQTDTEPSEVACCNETAIFEQAFLKHNWTTSVGNVRKAKREQDREMYFFIAKSVFHFFVYRTIILKKSRKKKRFLPCFQLQLQVSWTVQKTMLHLSTL